MGTLTFSPSQYIGMAFFFFFFFESTFRISVFLGFSEKMAILGVGRFKWILCCPLFIITLYKQEKTINNYKTSFSGVSNAISKPSSKIIGSKIVKKKIEGGQSTKLSPAT